MANVLEMIGICKRFGSVIALDHVDFNVAPGEIHALLGVNGAGKSTLIKILSGIYQADEGTIAIDAMTRSIDSPADAIDCGIASVQQHPELVDDFTGYENIFLGREGRRRGLFTTVNRTAIRERSQALLSRLPFAIDLDKKVSELGGVEKEIVAVLHALRQDDVKILVLDEPTSTLTSVETTQLFEMMRVLKEAGVAIVYITHRLEEVFEIADRFTVFRGGRKIATLSSAQAREDQVSIPQLMLQAEMGALYPAKAGEVTTRIGLEVDGLTVTGAFENVSFAARPGEILGFFGLVGSGIDALAKALFGIAKVADGQIWVAGKPVSLSSPRAALQSGIFLVPGDRRVEGLVLTDDVSFNSTLANLMRASRMGGFLKFSENRRNISELAERVELRPPALTRAASEFSGGNQQKIVIAKGLYRQADIYIFVEPTTGVDIGARLKLYGLIRELSQKSVVIVMSSDCDEIFGLCDRMGAMYKGRLALQPTRLLSRDQLLAAGIMSQPPQSQTNDEPGGSVQTIRL